jgi:hypothetical protein
MERARLELAAARGIKLSGMELAGSEQNGRPIYQYQEWWLAYPTPEDDDAPAA